jgi:hypothetical protein
MAGLVLLQHTLNLSDEEVVRRWPENPYWPSGISFGHSTPAARSSSPTTCRSSLRSSKALPSGLAQAHRRSGFRRPQEVLEGKLLGLTIEVGKSTGMITERSLEKVFVDISVQLNA